MGNLKKSEKKKDKLNEKDMDKISGGIKNIAKDDIFDPGFLWWEQYKNEIKKYFIRKFGKADGEKYFNELTSFVMENKDELFEGQIKGYILSTYGIICEHLNS